MKKRKQFLYFLAMLSLILTLPSVDIPSTAQAGTSIGTPSDAEEELPEKTAGRNRRTERDRCGSIGSPGPSQRDRIFRFCFDALR